MPVPRPTCPQCGNALVDQVFCPICGYHALVAFWLPRMREAMRQSLHHCVVGQVGRKRWWVSVFLVDAATWLWSIKVEEAEGKVLVRTETYRTLKVALEHHPGLISVTGWQPFHRLGEPRAFPFPESVFGGEA
jgi:hypothetical protein